MADYVRLCGYVYLQDEQCNLPTGHPGEHAHTAWTSKLAQRTQGDGAGTVNIPAHTIPQAGKALHFSQGKIGLDQLPVEVLMEWATVFDYGAEKYARDNWRSGTDWHEFYGSAFRHLMKWWMGEDIDPETGLNHLAHALWNIATLRYYQIHVLGKDDRPARSPDHYQRPQYNKPEKKS